MSLQQSCLLVSMTIHSPNNQRSNKQITQRVQESLDIATTDDRYTQVLLPSSAVAPVRSAINALRRFVNGATYPWLDGTRIIPTARVMTFMAGFKEHKAMFLTAVDMLVTAYPELVTQEKERLGDWFNASFYPDKDDFAARFAIDFALYPMPDLSTFRSDISQDIITNAQETWAKQTSQLVSSWLGMLDAINPIAVRDTNATITKLEGLRKDVVELIPTQTHVIDAIDSKIGELTVCAIH